MMVGIEIGRARCRQGVSVPALSIAKRVHSLTVAHVCLRAGFVVCLGEEYLLSSWTGAHHTGLEHEIGELHEALRRDGEVDVRAANSADVPTVLWTGSSG